VTETDILRESAEERNSLSDEYRHAGNDKAMNKANARESLNRNPAIDIKVLSSRLSKPGNDLGRGSGHLLHYPFAG
jgi:hypothetical protein